MIDINLFLSLCGAHLCGDFIAYTPALAKLKRDGRNNKKLSAIVLHSGIHFLFCLLWLSWKPFTLAIISAVTVFCVHGLIDALRIIFEDRVFGKDAVMIFTRRDIVSLVFFRKKPETTEFFRKSGKRWAAVNIIDQALHFASLAAITLFLPFTGLSGQ